MLTSSTGLSTKVIAKEKKEIGPNKYKLKFIISSLFVTEMNPKS